MSFITGREPRLSAGSRRAKGWRLSPRRLATLLNALPPEAISLEAAEAMLHSPDFYVRYNAAYLLGKRGDRQARLILQRVMKDGNAPSRASAARRLNFFSWYSAEPLFKKALKDPDHRVREAAVYSLCDAQDPRAYTMTTKALQQEADEVREAAAWGLRNRQDPLAVPVLEAVLLADDPDVRIKALEVLGANDLSNAVPIVRRSILNDAVPDVRYEATLSFVELLGDAALSELAEIIQHLAGKLRYGVLRGTFHATNYLHINIAENPAADAMINALQAAVQDELPQTRVQAVFNLAWMNHRRAAEVLRNAFWDESDSSTKTEMERVIRSLMVEVNPELLDFVLAST